MIDAQTQHDPSRAPRLVRECTKVAGSKVAAARRLGVSYEYLRLLGHGRREMSFTLQVAMQVLSGDME